MAATVKNDNARMHKPNPAKFYVPLCFQDIYGIEVARGETDVFAG